MRSSSTVGTTHTAIEEFDRDRLKDRQSQLVGLKPIRISDFDWEYRRELAITDPGAARARAAAAEARSGLADCPYRSASLDVHLSAMNSAAVDQGAPLPGACKPGT